MPPPMTQQYAVRAEVATVLSQWLTADAARVLEGSYRALPVIAKA